MNAIINNPFRILGLKPTASEKETTKRVSDLLIYAEMGKQVTYETDFKFLGEVDRSENAIKEAAKKIENIELKIFYSLLYFEIKDENDLRAIRLIENKKYDDAIIHLEESIFNNCPIVYSSSKTVVDVFKSPFFKETKNSYYSIKSKSKTNIQNIPIPFLKEYLIKTNFSINELKPIVESNTIIKDLDKYQISIRFRLDSSLIFEKKIGFELISKKQTLKHYITIDSSGKIILEQQRTDIQKKPIIVIEQYFKSSFFLEDNYIIIKRYSSLLEVWINNNCILKTDNNINYSSFCLRVQGSQTNILESLSLNELCHCKSYSSDIELNSKTYSHIKNLSLIYILIAEQKKNIYTFNFLYYFELVSNFYKQNYFKKCIKILISENYKIDFPKLTNIFVNEFYSSFKNKIDPSVKYCEVAFYSPFKYLSEEAENKAKNIIISQQLFSFEEKIKMTSNQRLKDGINSNKYAYTLMESATLFFKWYDNFFGYGSISYKMLADKVGKEILECAISYYNSHTNTTVQIANEAIYILNLSAEYAMNQNTRNRLSKNLSLITETHNLKNIIIDFKKKDIQKYVESISFKGSITSNSTTKTHENNTKTKIQKNSIEKFADEFNTSYKTPEYVYEFLLKCKKELLSFEKKADINSLDYQKASSIVVANILTYLIDSLTIREKKLITTNINQEIEFTIFLEKGLALFSKMQIMVMSPLIKNRFEKNHTIFNNKLNQHNTENEVKVIRDNKSKTNKNNNDKANDKKMFNKKKNNFWKSIFLKSGKSNQILKQIRGVILVIGFFVGFIFLVVFLINQNKETKSKPLQEISQWQGNQLLNGTTPYSNYFGKQIFNYNSNCWLVFKNGNRTDAIVCLENAYNGKVIRNVYIRAGTSWKMKNIPVGTYIVKSFHGNDWNLNKKLNNGQIVGAFDTDIHFSISDKRNDWITIEDNGYSYTTGEITLYTVSNGNMQQRNINSNEFFK